MPKMYEELASWCPLVPPAEDYEEEAEVDVGPDPSDTTYVVDYTFPVRTSDGEVRTEHNRHIEGCSHAPIGSGC